MHKSWFGYDARSHRSLRAGVTLIELLCVIVVIGILASLLLPALFRVYNRIRGEAQEMEASQIAELLVSETRNYCAAQPRYNFTTKDDFLAKCGFNPKCSAWIEASTTDFVPFNHRHPTNKMVLVIRTGRNHATVYSFTKGELSIRPEGR